MDIGQTKLHPTYRADLRTGPPDVFESIDTNFSELSWKDIGRPYKVENYSEKRKQWEKDHDQKMPVPVQWQHFNRSFHEMLNRDTKQARSDALTELFSSILDPAAAYEAAQDLLQTQIWNYVHRIQDAVWDPRGKRALFRGLNQIKPDILFIGASDNYEGMQMQAMYPGGKVVAVDYDPFCKTDRFEKFPEEYPFLGTNPQTGGPKVYHKEDFNVDYRVEDVNKLDPDEKFDIVLSVGFLEHVPDELDHGLDKRKVLEMHRRFLKPSGYAVITTPRNQLRTRLFYRVMEDLMNYGYRELMDARQLGKYADENGLRVERCGYIKGHNGIVARA